MTLYRPTSALEGYTGLVSFAGDIHNHCAISYGHGSLADAYDNARLQLDFASVTGHAAWPDMPAEPAHVAAYHQEGFARLRRAWPEVQRVTESVNVDGEFVSFLSFEWHSMAYGDHCVYYRSGTGPLEPSAAATLPELREHLRRVADAGLPTLAIPHHIGYRRGFRGINWDAYTEEFAPVIELVSMHGCGEEALAPRPYLHTMGPRDRASLALTGLAAGHHFGFIGSTDHHSAHPGSYGYGRAMVWAPELTRGAIWDAIVNRRTYCVTGDRIGLATNVEGVPMGGVATAAGTRRIDVSVSGGGALDYVEVVRNGLVIDRQSGHGSSPVPGAFSGTVALALGWGEVGVPCQWDVRLEVEDGRIDAVEPQFHGADLLDPTATVAPQFQFSRWEQVDAHTVAFRTATRGNPSVTTDATQRLVLRVSGTEQTRLRATINGAEVCHTIGDLLAGPIAGATAGFLSPWYVFDRAEPAEGLNLDWSLEDAGSGAPEDWYYVRVRQRNDQYAWSSPTWVRRAP